MNTKQFFTPALAVALLLAGCSQDAVLDKGGNERMPEAIAFDPVMTKATSRVAATTTATLKDFKVYVHDGATSIMEAVNVTYDTDKWTYATPVFWPYTGTVEFAAYSPSASTGVTITGNPDAPVMTYTVPDVASLADLANQEDLVVAYKPVEASGRASGPVNLHFQHALTRVQIKARSAVANDYTITSVGLHNLKNKADLALEDSVPASGYLDGRVRWNNHQETVADYVVPVSETAQGSTDNPTGIYSDILVDDEAFMILPQTTTLGTAGSSGSKPDATNFYISITVGPTTTYIPVADPANSENPITFGMGRQYTFLLNITSAKIELGAIEVMALNDINEIASDNVPTNLTGKFAGSNIYWDGTKLTFADRGTTDKELYQGVLFKWGSLIGISPDVNDAVYGASTHLYVPDPTGAMFTDVDNATSKYATWAAIPYASDSISYGRRVRASHNYLYSDLMGYAAYKGDICRYLTDKGLAPGHAQGKKWRMPVLSDWGSADKYTSVSSGVTTPFALDVSGQASGAEIMSWSGPSWSGQNASWPSSGYRNQEGKMVEVSTAARFWTGAAADNTNGYSPYFITSNLYFTTNTNNVASKRDHALPVRCVEE